MPENEQLSPSLAATQRVGRYELRRELGRGMMGVVYEAYDPDLGRRIALKTLRLAFAVPAEEENTFRERFVVEARAAARLSHPGIVIVHDVGRDPGTDAPYIAFEYLEGHTLDQVAREETPLAWRDAVRLAERLARALDHAHARGVVHRDLKPANVMVLPTGEPKIMDFGIAKLEAAHGRLTATGQFFGTPLYMSPEQALGRSVDARSDLFSLGAILYTLVTGRLAFSAENVPRIVERVVRHEPEPPSRLVPDLPPDFDVVLASALAKDPAERYASAGALADDLEHLLAGRAPSRVRVRAGTAQAAPAELDDLLATFGVGAAQERTQAGDSPLATLVDAPPDGARELDETQVSPPAAALATEPDVAPRGAGPGRASARGRLVAALVGVLLLAAVGGLLLRGGGSPETPARPAQLDPPRRDPITAPAQPPVEPPPAPAEAVPDGTPAQLLLDFEHPLKRGVLRLWIDGELAVEEQLDSRTRKIAVIKLRKGGFEQTLDVAPGRREIEVEVAWDDNRKRERIAGTFKPGATRRLEVRLGRIRKNLSADWK